MEEKTIKNSKIPEIRFKGFTDAWEQRKFGDCVLIQRGGSPRPIENYITKDEEGINWVKIGDVSADSRYITTTKEKIIPEGEKFSRRVQIGDLILSNSMSFGRPYIMAVDGCIHDGWLLIRDNKNLFDQEYLLQLLSSNYMYSQYRSLASGGVVNNLNSDLVQSTTALIPNKEEQSKLGAFFSKLDNLITLHQRKYEKLLTMKKSCLEKMFPKNENKIPEIRFKGFTDAWEQRKLGEIVDDIADGPFGSNLKAEHYTEEKEARIVQLSNIGEFGWQDENVKYTTFVHAKKISRSIAQAGNLIMAKMMPAGMTIICPNIDKMYVLSSDAVKIKLKKNINSQYFLSMTKSDNFLQQIDCDAQGSTRTRTSISKIRKMNIPIPELSEQKKLGKFFTAIDHLITLHQRKLKMLQNIKKSCLEKMFV